jgi:GT2 family glycosyltransferase
MTISVVVSAYNNWRALDRTLLGFRCQTLAPLEVIVAEDSQWPEVATVVARHRPHVPWPIVHLRQPNQGFRKPIIMNQAIARARGALIVCTDADCVPRDDILAVYARHARPGFFLAGGSHVSIPESFHLQHLEDADITTQHVFCPDWLAARGIAVPRWRLSRVRTLARMLDRLTPRNSFNGAHTAAWRHDLLKVGGFDESMGYGGEDRNLGYRLNHAGIRGMRLRHSLVWLHLDHPRSYVDPAIKEANLDWNRTVRQRRLIHPRISALLRQG